MLLLAGALKVSAVPKSSSHVPKAVRPRPVPNPKNTPPRRIPVLKQTPPRPIEVRERSKSRAVQHPKQTKPRPVVNAEVAAAANGAEGATTESSLFPPVGVADIGNANAPVPAAAQQKVEESKLRPSKQASSVGANDATSNNLDALAVEEQNGRATAEQKSQPKLKRPKDRSSNAAGKPAGVSFSTGTPTGKQQDDFRKIVGVDKDKLRERRMDSSKLSRASKRAAFLEKKRMANDNKPKPAPIDTNFEVVGAQIDNVDSSDADFKSEETTTNVGADEDELFLRSIQDDLDSAVQEGIKGLLQIGQPAEGDY